MAIKDMTERVLNLQNHSSSVIVNKPIKQSWDPWNPKTDTVCFGVPFQQTRINKDDGTVETRDATGTKAPTYDLVANVNSANEGSAITFTLNTTCILDGTNVPYTISGIDENDLSSGSISGNFIIVGDTDSVSITLTADKATEGPEVATLTLGIGSSISILVNDTSVAPTPTPTLTPTPTSSVVPTSTPSPTPTPTPTLTPTEPEVAPPTLGVNASYIGFGASTGGSTDEHWIHDFQFTSTLPQQSINYNNFYNNSTVVNNAIKTSGSIRLTQASGNQRGTVFYNNPVGLLLNSGVPNDWSVFFEFSIGGGVGFADGISFILQSNTLNTGGSGGGIGYAGIPNSVAVSYDTWINTERPESQETRVPHVEINVDGSIISAASTTTALLVSLRGSTGTGSRRYTWIDYTNQVMRVYLSDTNTKPGSPILTHNINVGNYIVL